jgi:hypothetical protein
MKTKTSLKSGRGEISFGGNGDPRMPLLGGGGDPRYPLFIPIRF